MGLPTRVTAVVPTSPGPVQLRWLSRVTWPLCGAARPDPSAVSRHHPTGSVPRAGRLVRDSPYSQAKSHSDVPHLRVWPAVAATLRCAVARPRTGVTVLVGVGVGAGAGVAARRSGRP